ncbi:AcoB Pyruvate/2-oxoglutarate dehydrogenase complex, dehydrogenase (E1) component, eukaryotic type, beta subunit [uncultured Caudovirales phage]|uniref:AcoB Pyruvate/2-oxoglutarate dehydrogenase complex, dehydrogenase (E1) component, eukaryotic type, beta subunit n=1 Tax=uncultured Caudovirales phage TaxID=2100421 RepID=A0A6J5S9Z2_9CAUD|nr:AcoB Pyruvate/2-oxoglutarate dehydrogenase complex, dehydrogenase (E1) component, eukaryotic type, beta subunit [uncultured Caudovirales phage]CAB4210425.1 AcoB Pyruvate/2-oxoglutarate dehydrogenase complex, dehydrogenase (E1) component, eukaryotic type, beta subunit [uncultured Caudovirales phage]CAB4223483.1 AcoB Pyruvate/2-oxoglutarate dehydrogenase complex, dehydrogenase (E1) component, eukaryotic type, beta subunit [uncultured Caudovirales phage]
MLKTYAQAINDATRQIMTLDKSVVLMGQAVPGHAGVFGTTSGLVDLFGPDRVFDTPISEHGVTQMAAGMAQAGLRPIVVHQRVDFSLYALDSIINWIAPWRFISGGNATMPLVIRMIVGKGWGQGPQHSKSLYSLFAHIPGLRVVTPGSPSDVKGLLISSVLSNDPVIFIEPRSLYSMTEEVPDEPYQIPLGPSVVRLQGGDVTLVTFSAMVPIALEAARMAADSGVSVEVVDLRSISPLDLTGVINSVRKTARLVVCEADWRDYGVAAEIVAGVSEALVMCPRPVRVTWPNSYVGASQAYEKAFYPTAEHLCQAVVGQYLGSVHA